MPSRHTPRAVAIRVATATILRWREPGHDRHHGRGRFALPNMVIADMQGGGEGVGTARGAVTVATAVNAVVSSAIFEQGGGAQVNAQGSVVRLGHEARQSAVEEPEGLETVAFDKRIHGRVPEIAQRARKAVVAVERTSSGGAVSNASASQKSATGRVLGS